MSPISEGKSSESSEAPPYEATVGVVVPVYNRARKLLDALDSVAGQSNLPASLVVVDDGSTDDTFRAASRWKSDARRLPQIEIVRQPNRGVSAARNAGFSRVAHCDFVAFLDSDDSWPPDFLQAGVAALAANGHAVAAISDRLLIQPGGATEMRSSADLIANPVGWLYSRSAGISSCTLLRSNAVTAVEGFDESLPIGEDADFFLRISLLGGWEHLPTRPVLFCRDMGATHEGQPNLSRRFENGDEQRAAVYDEMLGLLASSMDAKSLSGARIGLAKWWMRAGKAHARKPDQRIHALACYRRALGWSPGSENVLRSYLGCLARTIGQRRVPRRRVSLRPLPTSQPASN